MLGYHHPDIRMRLAYHFIVNCCVYSGGEAVAEGEQAAVAAVTADDSNATDKVIAIEMGPPWQSSEGRAQRSSLHDLRSRVHLDWVSRAKWRR